MDKIKSMTRNLFANNQNILYNKSMELQQVANYINGRFLLSNLKIDKKALLTGELLSSYSVDSLGSGKNEQIYYDTADFFFADKGINIYTMTEGKTRELIIRYDNEQVQRIEFLKNTPNFFKMKIDKNDSILKYTEQINEAIYQVLPAGLHVNIDDMLRASSPQISILKKRDSYRVVNNAGLKTTMYFDETQYINLKNRQKFAQPTLDVVGDSIKNRDDFNNFLRSLVIDCPRIVKIESNELTVARKNLN